MIARELYEKVLALIDSYTEDGVKISETDNIDIEKKFIIFLDMAQKELWKYNKRTKPIKIICTPPTNLIDGGLKLLTNNGETEYFPSETGVKNAHSYSVRVNGDCKIEIQEKINGIWTNLIEIDNTEKNIAYKGILNVSDSNNYVRMKLSSDTYFSHIDRALFDRKYKTDDEVLEYSAYIKKRLPDDFNSIKSVIKLVPDKDYFADSSYKLENYRDFYYNSDFKGEIRIEYKPIPVPVTSLDDEIDIDDVLAQSVVYDIVGKLGFYENKDLINYAEQRRIEMKAESLSDSPSSIEIIQDFYYGGDE